MVVAISTFRDSLYDQHYGRRREEGLSPACFLDSIQILIQAKFDYHQKMGTRSELIPAGYRAPQSE
jgi:hypothetical protein